MSLHFATIIISRSQTDNSSPQLAHQKVSRCLLLDSQTCYYSVPRTRQT